MDRPIFVPLRHSRRLDAERADLFGRLVPLDIERALRGVYQGWPDQLEQIARNIRCAGIVARHAWCAGLDALNYRETPCRCVIGRSEAL